MSDVSTDRACTGVTAMRLCLKKIDHRLVFAIALVIANVMCGLVSIASRAQADDKSAAEQIAGTFVDGLEQGNLDTLYAASLSPNFKSVMSSTVFNQEMGMWRIQTGGPATSRAIVGSQPFSQMPNGKSGNFYYVRFRSQHPNGPLFDDVYLEKVGDDWKVVGIYFFPVPASQ